MAIQQRQTSVEKALQPHASRLPAHGRVSPCTYTCAHACAYAYAPSRKWKGEPRPSTTPTPLPDGDACHHRRPPPPPPNEIKRRPTCGARLAQRDRAGPHLSCAWRPQDTELPQLEQAGTEQAAAHATSPSRDRVGWGPRRQGWRRRRLARRASAVRRLPRRRRVRRSPSCVLPPPPPPPGHENHPALHTAPMALPQVFRLHTCLWPPTPPSHPRPAQERSLPAPGSRRAGANAPPTHTGGREPRAR